MTMFEQLAIEMGVEIKRDKQGFYTGITEALCKIATDVVLSDDDKLFEADWDTQKQIIKDRFYKAFPYMK